MLLGVATTPAIAQRDPAAGDRDAPVVRCGKAEAALRLMRAAKVEPPEQPAAAYLAAMGDTDVLHNDLDIELTNINPATNSCTITGRNTMTIRSTTGALTEFQFRLRNQFSITGAFVNGSTPVTVTAPTSSTRSVTLDRAYGIDEVFTLRIEYNGTTVSAAFGSIEVRTHSGGIPVVASLSEPYYAYTWWPAKDGDVFLPGDNSDKATLDFALTAPSSYTVAANGLLEGVDLLSGSRSRHRWASAYPMTTYLVSFSATQYNSWTVNYAHPGGSMPVQFFIYPSNDNASNRLGWEKVVTMLGTFRPLYGEYPFVDEKYGIYNFPFGGGMEHQTMTGQSAFSEGLSAHELAHQWWGDAVTCKTWNHIWLNEGFASYAEALWAEHKPGSSGLPALKSAMAGMKYTGPGSVYVYDDEVDSLWDIFDGSTSYDKGAWVLHMLRHVLGDPSFFAALADYRALFEDAAATTEDFQAVCEGHYPGGDLDWFFSQWVYEEGAPSYAWGWTTTQVNGKQYLLISVDQTQSAAYPRFTMPIDLVVGGSTVAVFNDSDTEHFVIPVLSSPASVSFDPNAWVLWGSRTEGAYTPGPPTIVETSPAPGAFVEARDFQNTISVYFHAPVNLAPGDVSLVGDATGPRSFTLASQSGVNPVVLNLDGPLQADTYTVTIGDGVTGASGGLALDGELIDPDDAASFPSGDGSPGGVAIIRFQAGSMVPQSSAWGVLVTVFGVLIVATVVLHGRRAAPSLGTVQSQPVLRG